MPCPTILPLRRRANCRANILEMRPVARVKSSTYRAGHHVSKLYAHANVRWGEEQRLDKMRIVTSKRNVIPDDPLVARSQHLVLSLPSVVSNHDAELPSANFSREIPKVIEKSLR